MKKRWSDTDSDESLMQASLRDVEAFGVFYRRHVVAVHRFYLGRLTEEAMAADLTAEAFATAVATRTRFDRGRGSVETWLWQIVRSKLADHLRHQAVVDKHRRSLGMTIDATVDKYDLGGDDAGAMEALERLPDDQRSAVKQHVIDEVSHHEIARLSGASPATVRKRVSRGLQTLRRSLDPSNQSSSNKSEMSDV
jgi:RNA polymerase sigma-70 factor (ECF subfamily)